MKKYEGYVIFSGFAPEKEIKNDNKTLYETLLDKIDTTKDLSKKEEYDNKGGS